MSHPVTNPNLEGYNVVVQMWRRYWNPQQGTFIAGSPRCSGTYNDEGKFNVWSVAVAVQAIVDGARIFPQELGPLIDPVVKALYRYRSPQFHGYCAAENFPGNCDIYYDDDAQVASALLMAYEVTQNPEYLNAGRELVRYLMGGWNSDRNAKIQGGMLWHRDKGYIAAISNAEVAHAVLQLAKFVPNERDYLIKFAIQCIDWQLDHLQDKEDKLIQDGIDKNADGGPNGMKWTYNTGMTLSCAVHLYEFTHDQKWLDLSNELAAAATDRNRSLFCRDYNEMERRYWRDPSYFVQLLIEGLSDYMLVIGPQAPESTVNAIKLEFKRHLEFFRKYNYDPKDGLYFQMFEAFRISPEVHKRYCEQFGDSKGFDANPEERASEGGGDAKDKPLVKTLIGSGAAARVWFQAARVVPEIQY